MIAKTNSEDLFDLTGKVVVITGASSGIGEALAGCFAGRGSSVVLAARRTERITELATTLEGSHAVACDVTDDDSCRHLVDEVMSVHGRIDVLINNAGTYGTEPAESEPLATFRSVVETNLIATFNLSRLAAVPMMAATGGSIINIASVFGLGACGAFPQSSYTASKGGVVNLTRELAAQWARRGVRVNAVAPSYFESEMTSEAMEDEGMMKWIRRRTPMGRPGELSELFGPVIFLASRASSFVTGTTLAVDGGWSAI